jgi:FkbM family methyltransferase
MGETINKQWERIIEQTPEPDLFLDCGPGRVNVSREAWIAKEVWPNCSVIGVEACEARYRKLKSVYPGSLYHMAVDEAIGQAAGYVGGRHGMFMFGLEKDREEKYNNHEKISVESTTVDHLYENSNGGTVFIWADIEGAELRMLKGATSLLSSGKVVGLNLELCPQNAQKIYPEYTGTRCTADEVIDFLGQYNIECRGSHTHPNLVYGDFESKNWFRDFLFVPGE